MEIENNNFSTKLFIREAINSCRMFSTVPVANWCDSFLNRKWTYYADNSGVEHLSPCIFARHSNCRSSCRSLTYSASLLLDSLWLCLCRRKVMYIVQYLAGSYCTLSRKSLISCIFRGEIALLGVSCSRLVMIKLLFVYTLLDFVFLQYLPYGADVDTFQIATVMYGILEVPIRTFARSEN